MLSSLPVLILTLTQPTAGDEVVHGLGSSPFERGEVVAFEIPERPGTRHEYFVLSGSEPDLGVAAVHVGAEADAMRTELCLDYFPIKTRVMHVERLTPTGPRLIWRETRLRSGRTVQVDWGTEGDSLASIDWSGRDAIRRQSKPEAGALLPLYLVERVREGQFLDGLFDVFDPVSNRVEEWHAKVERVAPLWPGFGSGRRLVLNRADGSMAGEYVFQNGELILFRLQKGGAVGVRIDAPTYQRLLDEELERRNQEFLRNQPSPASTRWVDKYRRIDVGH